jgi:hypothetical protein
VPQDKAKTKMDHSKDLREDIEDIIRTVCKSTDYGCQVAAEAIVHIIVEQSLANGSDSDGKNGKDQFRGDGLTGVAAENAA